jgi:hypothetical protein
MPVKSDNDNNVTVGELRDAVLIMIDRDFDGRPLDIETATNALAQASFELKVMHLRALAERERERVNEALRKKLAPRG